MIRVLVIAVCVIVVVVIGITVWSVTIQPDSPAPAATVAPKRQHFDLEGGQEMRPRWGSKEGGADGTSGN